MKKILILVGLAVIMISGYYYFRVNDKIATPTSEPTSSPDRVSEVNGYILSVSGNEIRIANEIGVKEITEEERARRQKLSQDERQALKAQESAKLVKEELELIIPVGVSIVKGSGDATGSNLPSMMSEMTKGVYASIWIQDGQVEFVKLKGVVTQ